MRLKCEQKVQIPTVTVPEHLVGSSWIRHSHFIWALIVHFITFCPFFLVDSIKALVLLDCIALWDTMLSTDGTHLEGVLRALKQAVFPSWITC